MAQAFSLHIHDAPRDRWDWAAIGGLFGTDGPLVRHVARDAAGRVAEVDASAHPLLADVAAWIEQQLGMRTAGARRLRWRAYGVGGGHPVHLDHHVEHGLTLVATAVLSLSDHVVGGTLVFPDTPLGAVAVPPRAGRLVAWRGVDAAHQPDPASSHLVEPVQAGERQMLAYFVYAPADHAPADHAPAGHTTAARTPDRATWPPDVRVSRDGSRPWAPAVAPDTCPGLFVVDDGVPQQTLRALRTAAEVRDLPVLPLDAGSAQAWREVGLPPGALLYTPATSLRAQRLQERMWRPGVATLFAESPLQLVVAPVEAMARAGVPIPPFAPLTNTDRAQLRDAAAWLGGFPLVMRFSGHSRGDGIVRVDSLAALFSLADHARARGACPDLVAYVADAEMWRIAVVDGRAAGWCRGAIPEDDFRSVGPSDPADYHDAPPPAVVQAAIAATQAVGVVAAGVDVLWRAPDEVFVLEANFPFYFGHLQAHGHDVAGAIVEALLRRAASEGRGS